MGLLVGLLTAWQFASARLSGLRERESNTGRILKVTNHPLYSWLRRPVLLQCEGLLHKGVNNVRWGGWGHLDMLWCVACDGEGK